MIVPSGRSLLPIALGNDTIGMWRATTARSPDCKAVPNADPNLSLRAIQSCSAPFLPHDAAAFTDQSGGSVLDPCKF